MKLARSLFIAPALLIPQISAGEVHVTITGIVGTNSSTAAPYDGIAVGSTVQASVRVITPATPYLAVDQTWVMKFEGAPPEHALFAMPFTIFVSNGTTGDGLGWPFTNTQNAGTFLNIDLPSTAFDSSDIEDLAGTYATLGGGFWTFTGNGISMDLIHQTLLISPPLTGGFFCDPMSPNSTGTATQAFAHQAPGIANQYHLEAICGPPGQMGYFLVGSAPVSPGIPIGDGLLCLSPASVNRLGRYNVSGTSMNSMGAFDDQGVFLNLSNTTSSGTGFDVPPLLPFPGSQIIVSGETWFFQHWHREANGRSNFSNGIFIGY